MAAEEKARGGGGEETRHKLARARDSSLGSDGTCFIPPAMCCVRSCPQGCSLDSVTRNFMGRGLPTQHTQSSRLPEGKPEFSINHSVCAESLSIMNPSYQGMVGTLPESHVPGHRPRASPARTAAHAGSSNSLPHRGKPTVVHARLCPYLKSGPSAPPASTPGSGPSQHQANRASALLPSSGVHLHLFNPR